MDPVNLKRFLFPSLICKIVHLGKEFLPFFVRFVCYFLVFHSESVDGNILKLLAGLARRYFVFTFT